MDPSDGSKNIMIRKTNKPSNIQTIKMNPEDPLTPSTIHFGEADLFNTLPSLDTTLLRMKSR